MTEREKILELLKQRRESYRGEQSKQEAIEKRYTQKSPDMAAGTGEQQKISPIAVVAHNRAREAECAACAIDYCIQTIEGWK